MPDGSLVGGCLCGTVRFKLSHPIRNVIVCHCRQCARWTGYAVAATAVTNGNFKLLSGSDALRWYASSAHAERGFCSACGSSLFWKPLNSARISVLAGSLDVPTGLTISAHINVHSKSDYYDIADGAPQYERGAGNLADVCPEN